MKKHFLKNIEWKVLICSLLLFIVGLFALYSATSKTGFGEFYKQINWFLISIPVLILFTVLDYNKIAKYSFLYYICGIIMLLVVLKTKPIAGASSWIKLGFISFQPSEIFKFFIIISVASLIVRLQIKGRDEINKIYKLMTVLLVAGLPILLIAKQPDYGTAAAYVIALVILLYVSGIRKRYIFPMMIIAALGIYLIYTYILPVYAPHAINRIKVFLNPELDPKGIGYNVIQSKLAIGSGEVFGMGLLQGTQTQLGYLHPKTTDFIFSLIAEEMGFVVAGLLIVVYVTLIITSIKIAKTAKDNMGTYIAAAISGVFFYYMVQNIGMTMGLLPITGVPLPFVSYGGSSLVTNFMAIGLLLNISGRRQKAIFVDIVEEKSKNKNVSSRR